MSVPATSLQLQSYLTPDAQLHLKLATISVAKPGAQEVVIRVEATPINPTDIHAMTGAADIASMRAEGAGNATQLVMPVKPEAMRAMATRIGHELPVGTEGAGVVVAAGSSPDAQALLGKVVALNTGAMYTQYRVANIAELLVLKDGTTPVEAASCFVNPLTALSMVETMRREGHTAIVHTAAASNLGQMLNRVCLADGVPLVNIVRSQTQVNILKEIGAEFVLDSSSPTYFEQLTAAIAATNATLCFDPIGGGKQASEILTAMETVQKAKLTGVQRYGSTVHKQVYYCGLLDPSPIELTHSFGIAWSLGGWLLTNFLTRIDSETIGRLRRRIVDEITTTFASRYTRTISLREALDPATIAAYCRRTTGEKYLIAPQL